MADNTSSIGEPLDRVDGPLKVTGRATYAYEHQVPGAAFGVLVVSSIAKGRIASIDTSKASKQPGVLLVMTHENAPKVAKQEKKDDQPPVLGSAWQALQDDRIYYGGQPIAVVVAQTSTQARAAAKMVTDDVQPRSLRTIYTAGWGKAYSPKKAGGGGEPWRATVGTSMQPFGMRGTSWMRCTGFLFQFHNPMEPHATIAQWTGPDSLTVYDATQGIFGDADKIAKVRWVLKPENVRVISPYLGGGYCSKGPTWSHVIIAALAAKQAGRPVRLEVSRPQMFNMVGLRSQINSGNRLLSARTTMGAFRRCRMTVFRIPLPSASL